MRLGSVCHVAAQRGMAVGLLALSASPALAGPLDGTVCLGLFGVNGITIGTLAVVVLALVVAVGLLSRAVRRGDKTQHALEESEQRLQSILDATRDAAFFTTDVRGSDSKVLDISSGAIELFGYTRDEIAGQPVSRLFAVRDASRMDALHDTIAKSGKPMSTEPRFVRKDGQAFPSIMTTYPVIDDSGRTLAAMSFVVDMTEHTQTEQKERRFLAQIQHAEKLHSLEILAGGVAHDFNNLLVGVLGNADLALMDMSPMSPSRASVESIKTAAIQASELTRQLLAYSGNARFIVDLVNLNSIVEGMDQLLKASVKTEIAIHYDLAEQLPAVEVDSAQMRQLLVSLLTNASDSVGDGTGVVTVSTGVRDVDRSYLAETYLDDDLPEGPYVALTVSDTGAGMEQDVLTRLFDPFFSTKTSGRGLGLASVLGIVRGHKGAIRVSSELGNGSTFTILLPTTGEPAPVPEQKAGGQADPSVPAQLPGTVLIIDDDETVREVATAMLSRRGCTVLAAASGPEGVRILSDSPEQIDVIMLNMTMPGMDGMETLKALRDVKPSVDVVLCTGYTETAARERFGDVDLAGFVQKPFEMHQLLGLLSDIMARRRDRGEDAE